jgi:anaerobic selenocysteine-containing dehydrogenase
MNCHPTLCGMNVTVEDGRVTAVAGDKDNPDSRGFLCVRGRAAVEIPHNPERLLQARYRTDRTQQAWQTTSTSDALNKLAAHVKSHRPEQMAFWMGHGDAATNYGTRIGGLLARRFAHLYGTQWWHPAMICWGLGGFGLGLTGFAEVHSMDDMADHSDLILLWGANLDSQPNTAPRLKRAKKRGARVVAIDIRQTSATAQADQVILLKPGTDAALALALMHVIVRESLHDSAFIEQHTIGFDALTTHLQPFTEQWAADITGVEAGIVTALARDYAAQKASMIVLGGSSMHKSADGWYAGRAISCLPALTGSVAVAGGGFGPRHGAPSHAQGLQHLQPQQPSKCTEVIPDQMAAMTQAMLDGKIKTLLLTGTNMLSSFADSNLLRKALQNVPMIVCHDLFESDTIREAADIVLPATAWVEQLGCKMTHTHVYLMDQAIAPQGDALSLSSLLQQLATALEIEGYFPWQSDEAMINALLDHSATGHVTLAELRVEQGNRALKGRGIAHENLQFPTPSGKLEFYSDTAAKLGLPPLPVHQTVVVGKTYPLVFRQGRTLTHFHGFYDHGRALPSLHRLDNTPVLWMSVEDAHGRGISNDDSIQLYNQRGQFNARALVTDKILPGTVWMRDGWEGINRLTDGSAALTDDATRLFPFGVGQAAFDAHIEVKPI